MVPNNNLSVLPWYKSLEEQNARKWWVYDKVYPLFTPVGCLLPFQIIRKHRVRDILISITTLVGGRLERDGSITTPIDRYLIGRYENLPKTVVLIGGGKGDAPVPAFAIAYDENDNVLELVENAIEGELIWSLPPNTTYVLTQLSPQNTHTTNFKVYKRIIQPVTEFKIFAKDGTLVKELNPVDMGFTVKPFEDYDVIVYPGGFPAALQMDEGQYYAMLSDGEETWYSEMFTAVGDISDYIKLSWWDEEDFVMDAGTIVYTEPQFQNVLYLCTDIARPEYDFDEEVIQRGGYTFPVEQISKKRYKFSFLASEYLLDVMRLIRMADHIRIKDGDRVYKKIDTFLITPDWEDNGDVAGVVAEFTTETVAKKNGHAGLYKGDFNKDFNDDFTIKY